MKKLQYILLPLLAMQLWANTSLAQSTLKVCLGETVCHTIGAHRGAVQWQSSPDGINWTNVNGAVGDTLCETPSTITYYRAEVVEGSCAAIYTDVEAVEPITMVVDAGADASFCNGSSSMVGGAPTASGLAPFSYLWSPATGLDSPTSANPLGNPAIATTYTVMVTDSLGCIGTDSVTLNPAAAIVADAGPDIVFCLGGNEILGGSPAGSGGLGALSYTWSPAINLSSSTVANPVLTPTGPAVYVLTVTDSLNCFASDTMLVDTVSNGSSTMTFSFTGAVQTFVVPSCTYSISMQVKGAQGGANWVNNINFGGSVTADVPVTPGETLYVYVGGQPSTGTLGGYNGGGAGDGNGKGGGGASDVRNGAGTLNDRLVVGGAGGGAGYWSNLHVVGGQGGLVGGNGYRDPDFASTPGGLGATQTAGGANGTCINLNVVSMAGSFGQGGTPLSFNCGCEGYGGGGGWYGGAGSGNCRGGGGGSSYAIPAATNVVHVQGSQTGNGQVIFTW